MIIELFLNSDFLLKMVLVGDSGVGKSCLLKRFASNDWDPKFISTIGVDFEIMTLSLLDKQIRLQIVKFFSVLSF